MPLKKPVIIGIVVATSILLTILAIVGVYFIFFSGPSIELEWSKYDLDSDNVFRINRADNLNISRAQRNVRNFLEVYKNDSSDPNIYPNCNFFNPPPENKTCGVDLNQFSPCVNLYGYGMRQGTPCIFLKLKTESDFMPEFYNETNLPADMPIDLKNEVKGYIRNNPVYGHIIWVSCEGKSDEDKRNVGPISYLPKKGYSGFHFPCKSTKFCLHPLVALRFERPTLGVPINVRCRIWAENVDKTIDLQLSVD